MEENIINNDGVLDHIEDQTTLTGAKNESDTNANGEKANGTDPESVTLTKTELDKRIQSAEDKLRTSYTKKIKELEGKIAEFSPVEKSETELELERRLSELEATQKELDSQKAFLSLQDNLQGKGIDKSIAAYLKDDIDVEEFVGAFSNVLKESAKSSGYVPEGHNAGDKVTPEEWGKMKYSEQEAVMRKNPELYKRLMAKLKSR